MDQRSVEIYKEALKEGKECDYTIRLMVVGPQGVGKTTLVNRLLKLGLDHKEIESTNGIDVHVHRSVVTLHNGEWILNEDDVRKLTNHDYRLGKVVKSIVVQGNEQNDSDNVTNIDLDIEKGKIERKKEVHSEIATKAALPSRQHDDDAEVLAEETVSKSTSDTSVYQKHSMDAEIKEDLSKVIDAMKSGSSQNTYGQISVWDFGGDFIFYTTHQTFLSPRGIYLVVVDITKMLFDEYQDRDCYVDISGLQYLKMGEYIVFWLNSIHTYAGNNEGVPPVILVATHLDKLKGDQESGMEQFFDNVRNCLMENGMSLYNHLDHGNFGVDNTNLADDSVSRKLREKIFEVAKKQKYWGEEKPASWIKFEKILLEKQNIGIKILSFEEVIKLSKGVKSGSMNHEELDLFLKFQHAIGNLIYFSDLKEYIVLEPKWLINAFRCLITHEKFQRKMSSAIQTKWNVFS